MLLSACLPTFRDMCGRFALTLAHPEDIPAAIHQSASWIDSEQAASYAPRRVVNPTTYAPVAFRPTSSWADSGNAQSDRPPSGELNRVVVRFMRWGLIPSFAQQSQIAKSGPVLINARGETVLQKPSFRAISAKSGSKRCVVVTTGYYEWYNSADMPKPARGHSASSKLPYLIHRNLDDGHIHDDNESPLLLAGIYDIWPGVLDRGGKTERPIDAGSTWSFTIMTMAAADDIAWLHDRMPVCLTTEEAVRTWLDTSKPAEVACQLAFQASQRGGVLLWTRMLRDLSSPLPSSEQRNVSSPKKSNTIESFFSYQGSPVPKRRKPDDAHLKGEDSQEQSGDVSRNRDTAGASDQSPKKGDVNTAYSPSKRPRRYQHYHDDLRSSKEGEAPFMDSQPHDEDDLFAPMSQDSRGDTEFGFGIEKQSPTKSRRALPPARSPSRQRARKVTRNRSISDYFRK